LDLDLEALDLKPSAFPEIDEDRVGRPFRAPIIADTIGTSKTIACARPL